MKFSWRTDLLSPGFSFIDFYFFSQVSEVQMHESGSEPTSHTIPANQTEIGNNTENESRLRSSQTPPAEAPRVSAHSCSSKHINHSFSKHEACFFNTNVVMHVEPLMSLMMILPHLCGAEMAYQ